MIEKHLKKIILWMWITFGSIVLGIILFVGAVDVNFLYAFGEMPSLEALENPKNELASELYSADGVLLGRYYREKRTPVTYDEISEELITTLVSIEDKRFYDHSGMDFRGMFRVLVRSVILQQGAGGGSTLSQQLAKNLFKLRQHDQYRGWLHSTPLSMLAIKPKEWILAAKLERTYTKKEILTMFLNTVELGRSAFGIATASETFFSKKPKEIGYNEAAVVLGLINAPGLYDPISNPENVEKKRRGIMNKLVDQNIITPKMRDEILAEDLPISYTFTNHNSGLAPYFRRIVQQWLMPFCKKNNIDLWGDGLKIYTTLDSRLQTYAEESVHKNMHELQQLFETDWKNRTPWEDGKESEMKGFIWGQIKKTERYKSLKDIFENNQDSIRHYLSLKRKMRVFDSQKGEKDTLFSTIDSVKYYVKFLHSGMISINPHNGHIKAWVGGIDHKYFQYDHVEQGKRQPGSTFKPFVYYTALENGYSPCDQMVDIPISFYDPSTKKQYTPTNFDGPASGDTVTLREAMARSINTVAAALVQKHSPEMIVKNAHKIGIKSKIDAVSSIAFGTSDVSVYEMASAYGTFVNLGTHVEPYYISRIVDKEGNELYSNTVPETKEVISQKLAYLMVFMLRGGTEEKKGTSQKLRWMYGGYLLQDNEIGGKTGTTQSASDGWYMGITKDLVTGIWVGASDRRVHFRSSYYGQGAKMALPIFADYMYKAYKDPNTGITKGTFQRPDSELSTQLDCEKVKNRRDSLARDQFLGY